MRGGRCGQPPCGEQRSRMFRGDSHFRDLVVPICLLSGNPAQARRPVSWNWGAVRRDGPGGRVPLCNQPGGAQDAAAGGGTGGRAWAERETRGPPQDPPLNNHPHPPRSGVFLTMPTRGRCFQSHFEASTPSGRSTRSPALGVGVREGCGAARDTDMGCCSEERAGAREGS